jgi:hypothetical protein
MEAKHPDQYAAYQAAVTGPAGRYGAAAQNLTADAKHLSDLQAAEVQKFQAANGRLPTDQEIATDASFQHVLAYGTNRLQADELDTAAKFKAMNDIASPFVDQASKLYLQEQYGPGTHEPGVAKVGAAATNGNYGITASGGLWGNNPAYEGHADELTPKIARPDLMPQSYAAAQALASGKTFQDVLGTSSTPDQRAAMSDAMEILGISNRQIGTYAKAAKDGNIDASLPLFYRPTQAGKDAQGALNGAAQMRAAIDGDHNTELQHEKSIFGTSFDVSPTDYSVEGLFGAVAGAFGGDHEKTADLMFGGGGVKRQDAAFPDTAGFFQTANYGHAIQSGRDRLDTTVLGIEQW